MNDIGLSYKMALKLEMYMEKEIEEIAQDFQSLSWNYNETCEYKKDMKEGKVQCTRGTNKIKKK